MAALVGRLPELPPTPRLTTAVAEKDVTQQGNPPSPVRHFCIPGGIFSRQIFISTNDIRPPPPPHGGLPRQQPPFSDVPTISSSLNLRMELLNSTLWKNAGVPLLNATHNCFVAITAATAASKDLMG